MEDCTQVTIVFLPDMAEGWKEKYKKKRDECKSIVKLPKAETTEVQFSNVLLDLILAPI